MADFGYFDSPPNADSDHLHLYSWSREVIPALRKNGARKVRIVVWYNSSQGVEFLTECADQITSLEIASPQISDISSVSQLTNLEEFSVSFSGRFYGIEQRDLGHMLDQLDFSRLQQLRVCSISNVKSLGNLSACSWLEELSLDLAPLKDLSFLSAFKTLRVLSLSELRMTSVTGIEHLTALRTLTLNRVGLKTFDGAEALAAHFRDLDLSQLKKHARTGLHLDLDEIEAQQRQEQRTAQNLPALYTTPVSPQQPGCLIFLVDQSGSMRPEEGEYPSNRAGVVAEVVNRFLRNLTLRCFEDGAVRDSWHVGVFGYSDDCTSALGGSLAGKAILPLSTIAAQPLRFADPATAESDQQTRLNSWQTPLPVWIEPIADGDTRLRHALATIQAELTRWITEHPASFPPIVVHLTDGAFSDGHPGSAVAALKRVATTDGEALLFHLTDPRIKREAWERDPVEFPPYAFSPYTPYRNINDELFCRTSYLPPCMQTAAWDAGYDVGEKAVGFLSWVDIEDMLDALDIFTAVPGFEAARERMPLMTRKRTRPEPPPQPEQPSAPSSLPIDAAAPTRMFHFTEGSSDKFWSISQSATAYTVRFGRRGTPGKTQTKQFPSEEKAQQASERLIREKLRKGYVEVTGTADALPTLTKDQFWKLIDASRRGAADLEEQEEKLRELLGQLEEDQIIEFDRYFAEYTAEAYRWDLWGVAYLMQDGCSDDGFSDFLSWLISQGRTYYEAALANPENAGKRVSPGDEIEYETMRYVAADVYESKTGKHDFYDRCTKVAHDIKGEPWADDEELKELYPKLARKFASS